MQHNLSHPRATLDFGQVVQVRLSRESIIDENKVASARRERRRIEEHAGGLPHITGVRRTALEVIFEHTPCIAGSLEADTAGVRLLKTLRYRKAYPERAQ